MFVLLFRCRLPIFPYAFSHDLGNKEQNFGGTVQNRNKRVEAAYSWRSKEEWLRSLSVHEKLFLLKQRSLMLVTVLKAASISGDEGWSCLCWFWVGLVCEFRTRIEEWSLKDD